MQLYGSSRIGGGDMGTVYVLNISDIQTIWKTMLLFCALQIINDPPYILQSVIFPENILIIKFILIRFRACEMYAAVRADHGIPSEPSAAYCTFIFIQAHVMGMVNPCTVFQSAVLWLTILRRAE